MEKIINEIQTHLDDPNWLSRAIIELSSLLFTHNSQMANAHMIENRTAYLAVKEAKQQGEKMSNAEAEKIANVETEDKYYLFKVQAEAVIEIINSIKIRLKVLESERSNP